MSESIAANVAKLQKMTVDELAIEWERVYGRPTRQRHRAYLWKRLARKLQEDRLPKLTPDEEARVAEYRELIRQLPPDRWFPGKHRRTAKKKPPDTTPPPGSVITRKYRGQELVVNVLDDGFEFKGQVYRSLSAIAKSITGTTWNGPAWFGLRKGGHR